MEDINYNSYIEAAEKVLLSNEHIEETKKAAEKEGMVVHEYVKYVATLMVDAYVAANKKFGTLKKL